MRAKMQVNKVTRHLGGMETVEMGCVTGKKPFGPNGESEDNTFARYSPAGGLSITINNPDLAGTMSPGDKFYLDFTPAPEYPIMKTIQRNRIQPKSVTAKLDRRSGIVRLNVPLSVKAETINTKDRTFTGLAATWTEDLGQDVIHKGAFKQSIATWKKSTDALPLLNSHDHFNIFSALGQALAMKETAEGLEVEWEVLEGDDGDKVLQRIRPSARTGRAIIGKMSIGFVPMKFEFEQPEGTDMFWDRIRHINEADLKEVSLVLFPMNPGASIDASTVKSFLQLAHDTDPRSLDQITRIELRRLNSRIGLLLKKQKPEDEELEESEDTQSPPSSHTASVPEARTATSEADDTDETDLTDEQDDETDATEQTDDSAASEDTDTTATDTDKSKAKPVTDTKTPPPDDAEDEPKLYRFDEALQSRVQKVLLQRKIGNVNAPRSTED